MGDVLTQEQRQEQAAIMSTLMYFDDMYYEPGKTLAENIANMKANHLDEYEDMLDNGYAGLTYDEAKALFDYIENESELGDLIVMDINNRDNNNEIETGSIQGCFVNPETKEAIFAFKGTNTAEWIDNAYAFFGFLSPEQQAAVDYVNSKVEEYNLQDYAIDVTGHSKGGNKAKLITLMCDYIRNCFSFDGQGESPENLRRDDVHLENAGKIVNICADNDYVNPWGISVGNKIYVEGDRSGINAHNMAALYTIDSNGNISFNNRTQPSEATKWMCQVSDDLMKLPPDERGEIAKAVMTIAQSFFGKDYIYENGYPDVATIYEDAGLTKETLDKAIDFLVENGHLSQWTGDSQIMAQLAGQAATHPIIDEIYEAVAGTWRASGKYEEANNAMDKITIATDMTQQVVLGNVWDITQEWDKTKEDVNNGLIDMAQDAGRAGVDKIQDAVENTVDKAMDANRSRTDNRQDQVNKVVDALQAKTGTNNGFKGLVINGVQYLVNRAVDSNQDRNEATVNAVTNFLGGAVDKGQDILDGGVDGVQYVNGEINEFKREANEKAQQGVNWGVDMGQKVVQESVELGMQGVQWVVDNKDTIVPMMLSPMLPAGSNLLFNMATQSMGAGIAQPVVMNAYTDLINQKKAANAQTNTADTNVQTQDKAKSSSSKDDRGN